MGKVLKMPVFYNFILFLFLGVVCTVHVMCMYRYL